MALRKVNPWKWQDQFAFSQAIEASGATRTLYCAGQASVDGEGRPMHAGNMSAQLDQAFQNLATVLEAAGFTLSDVVRLNYYTTDIDGFSRHKTSLRAISDRGAVSRPVPCSASPDWRFQASSWRSKRLPRNECPLRRWTMPPTFREA